ncbi:peptidase S1, partial [Marinicauda algicola]
MITIRTSILTAGVTALALSASAGAQTWSADPTFGSVNLNAGFTPDPYRVDVSAGGSISAQSRFSDCRGYIADAPDFRVHYSAGSLPLYIGVDADAD